MWPVRTRNHRLRMVLSIAFTLVAAVAVWAALVLPVRLEDLTPSAFLRLPVELLVIPVVALLLPPRARRTTAWALGAVLGLVLILKLFDMGFRAVLDRSFDPVIDWAFLPPGVGVLRESVGTAWVTVVVVVVVLAAIAVLVLLPVFVGRLTGLAARHRRWAALALAALTVGWFGFHLSGVDVPDGEPVASATAVDVARQDLGQLRSDLTDRSRFAALAAKDPFASTPGDRLLTGLRGKDVLVVFVESYGRVAVEDSSFSPQVDRLLDSST